MKIAFTSCMSATAYPKQPVWNQILAHAPNFLILLGDSVYNDCPPMPSQNGGLHPSNDNYSDDDFCSHLHGLYQKQLAVPEFKKIIKQIPTYAIWDDHDFLWNDAGANLAKSPLHRGKAFYSSQLLKCWQSALISGGANFPKAHNDPNIQGKYANLVNEDYNDFMPGYRKVDISTGIKLHLTDVRSWRKDGNIIGKGQRDQIEAAIRADKTAIHLIASGSTFGGRGSQGWAGYPLDYEWLLGLSSQFKILMLSGDIHQNRFSEPIGVDGGMKLFEATSSGAAIDFIHVHEDGQSSSKDRFNYSEHFGILEFKPNGNIDVIFYDHGASPTKTISSTFKSYK